MNHRNNYLSTALNYSMSNKKQELLFRQQQPSSYLHAAFFPVYTFLCPSISSLFLWSAFFVSFLQFFQIKNDDCYSKNKRFGRNLINPFGYSDQKLLVFQFRQVKPFVAHQHLCVSVDRFQISPNSLTNHISCPGYEYARNLHITSQY